MKASPITFGGVPIGVAKPPIDAANATQRNNPVANSGLGQQFAFVPASSTAESMPATIATIIAVVAVLEIKALTTPDTTATASMIRIGRSPTIGSARTANASRRSSR